MDDYYNYTLRQARIDAGYTLKELAAMIGLTYCALRNYERFMNYPIQENAEKIAKILGKEVQVLFPESLREYVRQTKIERYGKKKMDALDFALRPDRRARKLEDETAENHRVVLEKEELRRRVQKILKTLPYREREIIKLRYGLENGYSYTLEEVGALFKVTRERVRQIEANAIRKLQQPSRSQELIGFLD